MSAAKRQHDPVTPWRPGDMPEPINKPKLLRAFHTSSLSDIQNMLFAANILDLDVTIESYKAELSDTELVSEYFIRVWDEQRWSCFFSGRDVRETHEAEDKRSKKVKADG